MMLREFHIPCCAFLQEAANAGLFVNLRIGPYISGEWTYGGLPIWLNQVPNILFRSSNHVWKQMMRQFILTIVDYVTPYLAKNGGPIIIAQIENEYAGNDDAYSVVEWFAAGGTYHAYFMWHGGNNYGHFAAAGVTTLYADDVCLHADGTPNEPKYTHLSVDPIRITIPYWDWNQKAWINGTSQFVYSYASSIHFLVSQATSPLFVLFRNQNISMADHAVRIYNDDLTLLWYSADFHDILSDNTALIHILHEPLKWQTWYKLSIQSTLPIIRYSIPVGQLNITNEETIYMWYRRDITLTQPSSSSILKVETRMANALLFFLDGQYLGEFDDHNHQAGHIETFVVLDLSSFNTQEQHLFEILSISLGLFSEAYANTFDQKGIDGNVWLDDQLLVDNTTETNFWEHQKGLMGEYFQIYTEQGSSKVDWDSRWTNGINRPVTWFQTRFDLDLLPTNDTNINPILLDPQGLNRGHAFINGNDFGLHWLLLGICENHRPCCCQHAMLLV